MPELTPNGPWKCFHCWEVFANPNLAKAHFGAVPSATPACVLRSERSLLYEYRELELERDILKVRHTALKLGADEDECVERFLACRDNPETSSNREEEQ